MLGRKKELAELDGTLEAARVGSATVRVLEGPAGIGKTTLLDAAWDRAQGFERLRIVAREAEAELSWAGLASLLLAWPDAADPVLAPIRAVLDGEPRSLLAVGSALHGALTRRAERAPLLLVVDDAQWLDPPSTAALAFAAHRLGADRVAVLVAQRSGTPRRFGEAPVLPIGALARDDALELVRSRFALGRDVAGRCLELTGGNPLALLHLGAALAPAQRRGARPIDPVQALPKRLADVFTATLAALPAATLRALAVLAAGGAEARLESVLASVEAKPVDLAAAEEAGIVAIDGRPELVHPLWAAAVLEHIGPVQRRRVHRAIAEHTSDPDRAAWQAALAAERPDEGVARALEEVARRSASRGLSVMAAQAWSAAARYSEAQAASCPREIAAAQASWDASLPGAARELLDAVIPRLEDARERASAVMLRNQVRAFTEDARGAALALRDEADRVRGAAPDLEAPLLCEATIAALLAADGTLALELSSRAADAAVDDAQLGTARVLRGVVATSRGQGVEPTSLQLLERFGSAPPVDPGDPEMELLQLAGYLLLVSERWPAAERALRAAVGAARRRGRASVEAYSSAWLAELEFRRGRWLDALTGATVDIALSEAREEARGALGHAVAARVLGHLGDTEACRARAGHALRTARALGLDSITAFAHAALGAGALAAGEVSTAAAELGAVWEIRLRGGLAEAGITWFQADLVEALVATGRTVQAEEIVRDVARNARATGGAWAAAAAARGRALLGKGSAREAVAAAEALPAPFERARTRLALVEHDRAGPDEVGLGEALATFERLGARPWAERARARLGRGGEAVSSLARQLSDAELRVAMLVGRGATNAEAGEQLVLSVRTVEAHLRSIFRKLGLRSRSELVIRVTREEGGA